MGPRHCCRGIADEDEIEPVADVQLQWGHGIAAVESTWISIRPYPCWIKLQWGHGIAAVESLE